MAESYGWAGKILRVNLTTGEITTQDDEKYHKYIGGMGMAYRIMYEEAPMELDPYDETAPATACCPARITAFSTSRTPAASARTPPAATPARRRPLPPTAAASA